MSPLRFGIAGVGVAGSARARAIAADPRCTAVAGWRGQPQALALPAVDSFDALLERVDWVAICTPDHTHPRLVERALAAGKGVICEYPLAGSESSAEELYALAASRNLPLHVAHIELLTPAARWMRARLRPGTLRLGGLHFVGGLRRDVTSVAHGNLARIHRLIDCLGPAEGSEIHGASLTDLSGRLRFAGGGAVDFSFRMEEGAARKMQLSLSFPEGDLLQVGDTLLWRGEPVTLPKGDSLFLQDQRAFSAHVLDGAPLYVGRERVLELLRVADRLQVLANARGLDEPLLH